MGLQLVEPQWQLAGTWGRQWDGRDDVICATMMGASLLSDFDVAQAGSI